MSARPSYTLVARVKDEVAGAIASFVLDPPREKRSP